MLLYYNGVLYILMGCLIPIIFLSCIERTALRGRVSLLRTLVSSSPRLLSASFPDPLTFPCHLGMSTAVTPSMLFPLPLLSGTALLAVVLVVVANASKALRRCGVSSTASTGKRTILLPPPPLPQVNKETPVDTSTVTSSCLHVGDFQFGMEAWHLRCLLRAF